MALISIGHSNDSTNIGYLTGVLRRGAWLGMDRNPKGVPGSASTVERIRTVQSLIDAGWVDKLMIGHDWDSNVVPHRSETRVARESGNPDAYSYIARKLIPALMELGVREDDIRKITVENPRRFFEGP